MTEIQGLNDTLRGERVYICARSIDQPRLSKDSRSGRHKRQETKARENVVCIVEQPWALTPRTSGAKQKT